MGKFLNDVQIEKFKKDGFLTNLRVLSSSSIGEIRSRLESFEKKQGKWIKNQYS